MILPYVSGNSQVFKLQTKLMEQGVSHDSVVEANLSMVRMGFAGQIFFCQSGVQIKTVLKKGDGESLPKTAEQRGLIFSEGPGYYNVQGVRVSANGRIFIEATENTVVKKISSALW